MEVQETKNEDSTSSFQCVQCGRFYPTLHEAQECLNVHKKTITED